MIMPEVLWGDGEAEMGTRAAKKTESKEKERDTADIFASSVDTNVGSLHDQILNMQ